MMYEFCKYEDGTEVVFSNIIENEKGEETMQVHFERPTEKGFDSVRFELPSYRIILKEGNYTEAEIDMFVKILESGAPSFFRWAKEGGIHIA